MRRKWNGGMFYLFECSEMENKHDLPTTKLDLKRSLRGHDATRRNVWYLDGELEHNVVSNILSCFYTIFLAALDIPTQGIFQQKIQLEKSNSFFPSSSCISVLQLVVNKLEGVKFQRKKLLALFLRNSKKILCLKNQNPPNSPKIVNRKEIYRGGFGFS